MTCWDAAIIGAGPAGASAAIPLARAGHRVLLIDKAPFPRDKVCGDGLIADALRCLERLGLRERIEADGHCARAVAIYSPARYRVELPGHFVTIPRRRLDAIVADEASHAGAVRRTGMVTAVAEDARRGLVRVDIAGVPALHARVAIVATGADVTLAARAGAAVRQQASAYALRCYVSSPVAVDDLIISFDAGLVPGYAWIFPLGGGCYNVGCGAPVRRGRIRVNLRGAFEWFCAEFPLAREIMRHATSVTPLKGARLRCGLRGAPPRLSPRVLLAGESIGATFPFTGEGIGKAMETALLAAELAGEALETGDVRVLASYPERLSREIAPRYRGYELADRYLSIGWIGDRLARRALRDNRLRLALAGILDESIDPARVFSAPRLVWSLLGGNSV